MWLKTVTKKQLMEIPYANAVIQLTGNQLLRKKYRTVVF